MSGHLVHQIMFNKKTFIYVHQKHVMSLFMFNLMPTVSNAGYDIGSYVLGTGYFFLIKHTKIACKLMKPNVTCIML